MVNLCMASVGNTAAGSVLQVAARALTHALVGHNHQVKESKCCGGRTDMGAWRRRVFPGCCKRRGCESRLVALQTLHFSQEKEDIPHPCSASSCPQRCPRGTRAGTRRTGPGWGALLFPGAAMG